MTGCAAFLRKDKIIERDASTCLPRKGDIMEKKTIRWAVCGLGAISRRWLKVASKQPDTKVVACASSSKARALKYQARYGLSAAFTYDELAASRGVFDAVYVCNNTNLHCGVVLKLMAAGIPVLCEKAIALTKADAEKMTSAAKANNTLLMEAMWTRFLPSAEYVRGLISGGSLGRIKSIRARFEAGINHAPGSRVYRRATGGGSVLDLGVYPASYSHMLLGVPESVTASGKLNKDGVDHCCTAELKYPGGVTVNFRTSLIPMQIHECCYITLEKGMIKIPRFYQAKRVYVKYADGRREKKTFEKVDGFKYEILHFNDLIRNNKTESPIMTHKASIEVMTVLEEMNRQLGVTF